jgi:DNA mismatch endonuclease (patch repair protein)
MGLTRAEQMSRIRGADTAPERRVVEAVRRRIDVEAELHPRLPFGRPDIVFPAERVAVFIDGCFWHGCPEHYVRPRTRTEFWSGKRAGNLERDRRQTLAAEAEGWRVLRFLEHEVFEQLDDVVATIAAVVAGLDVAPQPCWRVRAVEVIDADTDLERRHLEDLRGQEAMKQVDGRRTTRKWTVPRAWVEAVD